MYVHHYVVYLSSNTFNNRISVYIIRYILYAICTYFTIIYIRTFKNTSLVPYLRCPLVHPYMCVLILCLWKLSNVFLPIYVPGEMMKVTVEDYINHLANYKLQFVYKPEIMFGENIPTSNRIHLAFDHLYHWHPLAPDRFDIAGTIYTMEDFMFNVEPLLKHGMSEFVDSMSKNLAGTVSIYVVCTGNIMKMVVRIYAYLYNTHIHSSHRLSLIT